MSSVKKLCENVKPKGRSVGYMVQTIKGACIDQLAADPDRYKGQIVGHFQTGKYFLYLIR